MENFLTRKACILHGVTFLAGDHYLEKYDLGEKRIPVAEYEVNPLYNRDQFEFDIALLALKYPANFSSKVAPISLTTRPPTENLNCRVAGEFSNYLKDNFSEQKPKRTLQSFTLSFS